MQTRSKLILSVAAALALVFAFCLICHGQPNVSNPDQFGNTVVGAFWTTGPSKVGNIVLGFGSGANVPAGTDNILIGSPGVAGDNYQIRLGTPGTQTQCTIAGQINGNGAGQTNLQSTNIINNTWQTITNLLVTSNMSIVFVGGTNILITNAPSWTGRIVSIIVTNVNGSCFVTNGASTGGFLGASGVWSNNFIPLVGGSATNHATLVFDGLNWDD